MQDSGSLESVWIQGYQIQLIYRQDSRRQGFRWFRFQVGFKKNSNIVQNSGRIQLAQIQVVQNFVGFRFNSTYVVIIRVVRNLAKIQVVQNQGSLGFRQLRIQVVQDSGSLGFRQFRIQVVLVQDLSSSGFRQFRIQIVQDSVSSGFRQFRIQAVQDSGSSGLIRIQKSLELRNGFRLVKDSTRGLGLVIDA